MTCGHNHKAILLAGTVLFSSLVTTDWAFAGAFGIREQSTEFQGESFAGDAAGGALSSMFWNPAAAAAKDGINTESAYTALIPSTSISATGGLFTEAFPANGGSFAGPSLVPASYANYQINSQWYAGIALNSPAGFTVKPENYWAGSPLAETSKVFTININPNIAYKITPTLTIGVGLDVEYFHLHATSGGLPSPFPFALTSGMFPVGYSLPGRSYDLTAWGAGASVGALWQPLPTTTFGVGYKSPIDLQSSGPCYGIGVTGLSFFPSCLTGQQASHDFTAPQSVSVSVRHDLTEAWTVLATFEWTNWSVQQAGFIYGAAGQPVQSLPVSFKDGWFYAVGAEYKYSPLLTLRAGLSYEQSPVTDSNRTLFLPDSNRWTPSIGASYKWSETITIDVAYSHIFFADAPIFTSAPLLIADSKTDLDALSIGLKYRFLGLGALEPFK